MITDRHTIVTGAAAALVTVPAITVASKQRRVGMHGRHPATLSLAAFKEHTMITQRIAREIRG